uniref:Nucleosome assembly protein n=1 Tax=Craspedostauros australis TaxID=1486917 RepID=A0A7R9WWE8_9STRA
MSEEATIDKDAMVEEFLVEARAMKISELKLKLMAMGTLMTGFCEKEEFIQAYAAAQMEKVMQDDDDDMDDMDDNEEEELNAALAAAAVSGDPMDDLPPAVMARIAKLKEFEAERTRIVEEYRKERAQLEQKYQGLYQPLYDKRQQVVHGDMDVAMDAADKDDDEEDDEDMVGVPHFWLGALSNMGPMAETMGEGDIELLEQLQNIECDDHAEGTGFTLKFTFAPNEYMTNTVLTKQYEVPNLLSADEPILKSVKGCEIEWKSPEKCVTYTITTKQQRGKGKNAGQIRTVQKKEKVDSFFHFFTPPKMPSLEDMDEEQAQMLEMAFNQDYEQATSIRSQLIPKAVLWYTGEAMDQEMQKALKDMQNMQWPGGKNDGSDEANPECNQQ